MNHTACLKGSSRYGDCIEDEWFMTSIFFQLTNQFTDIIISLQDTDGDLLLIESADHIPDWLTPENNTNRVWFHKGQVYILTENVDTMSSVKRQFRSSSYITNHELKTFENTSPSLAEEYDVALPASPLVQAQINERITPYFKDPHHLRHTTHAYVPLRLAWLLHTQPHLIAPAVRIFYTRDPVQLARLKFATAFVAEAEGNIITDVTMTRTLYAMMKGQPFDVENEDHYTADGKKVSNDDFEMGMKLVSSRFLCIQLHLNKASCISSAIERTNHNKESFSFFLSFLLFFIMPFSK